MNQRGFTLIELLLSVTIITLLVGLSLPVYESFVRRNDLDLTTQSIVSALRRAQTYARGVDDDSTWGIAVSSSAVTLFKGTSYSARTAGFDETTTIPGSIAVNGTPEITFAKVTGAPSTPGTVTLTSTTNDTRTITLNVKGMVNY